MAKGRTKRTNRSARTEFTGAGVVLPKSKRGEKLKIDPQFKDKSRSTTKASYQLYNSSGKVALTLRFSGEYEQPYGANTTMYRKVYIGREKHYLTDAEYYATIERIKNLNLQRGKTTSYLYNRQVNKLKSSLKEGNEYATRLVWGSNILKDNGILDWVKKGSKGKKEYAELYNDAKELLSTLNKMKYEDFIDFITDYQDEMGKVSNHYSKLRQAGARIDAMDVTEIEDLKSTIKKLLRKAKSYE